MGDGQRTRNSSWKSFSIAELLKSPGSQDVSLTATFNVVNKATAMFTVMADFLAGSRWRLFVDNEVAICSRIPSCIFGACKGRAIANKLMAALTTSVAGGSGRSCISSLTSTYNDTESCSLEPHMGDKSYDC